MKPNGIKVLVLGIGNYLMGDEGIGVHTIQCLEQEKFPPEVQLLDGGVGNFLLLESMESCENLILIDAASDGKPKGTISKIFPKFSSDYPRTLTAHDIGLKDLLDAFYLTGKQLPNVVLFTVSIDSLPESLTTELSPEMKNVLPILCDEVKKEIQNILESKRS
ncbi:MAG: hydrogenase maturation protease [Leptospiraceae bacterium]|nr:hydrogenase maturation protease [Leptospiraceae bacterium]MDW7976341.1 hydrogenase maturation protease [Leptospiraceae bacterium]